MRKLIIAVAAFVAVLAPSIADAAPKHHHDKPVISRAIDWD